MMSRKQTLNKIYDRSIPGYTELSGWPIQPSYPEKILAIIIYRDGGTVGVTIQGKKGQDIEFFFDRFLGRLCYGECEKADDAAYIKKGSQFEKEVYAYLEAARKKLNSHIFSISSISTFNKYFKKAQIYCGV